MPFSAPSAGTNPPAGAGAFQSTPWSRVLRAAGEDSGPAGAALAELCEAYWYPLYAFVRRSGHDPEAAQDLTQAFFARLAGFIALAATPRDNHAASMKVNAILAGILSAVICGANATANLIINPGAEAAAGSPPTNLGGVVTVPGWTVSGNFTAVQYDTTAASGFPMTTSPGPGVRGGQLFRGRARQCLLQCEPAH